MSLSQVLAADRELFQLLSHNLMGQIQAPAGASRPLDDELVTLSTSPEVLFHLLPLPKPAPPPPAPHPTKRPLPDPKRGGGKGGGKGKTSTAGSDNKEPRFSLPEGCVAKNEDGKPWCFAFNQGRCKFKSVARAATTAATFEAVDALCHSSSAPTLMLPEVCGLPMPLQQCLPHREPRIFQQLCFRALPAPLRTPLLSVLRWTSCLCLKSRLPML